MSDNQSSPGCLSCSYFIYAGTIYWRPAFPVATFARVLSKTDGICYSLFHSRNLLASRKRVLTLVFLIWVLSVFLPFFNVLGFEQCLFTHECNYWGYWSHSSLLHTRLIWNAPSWKFAQQFKLWTRLPILLNLVPRALSLSWVRGGKRPWHRLVTCLLKYS